MKSNSRVKMFLAAIITASVFGLILSAAFDPLFALIVIVAACLGRLSYIIYDYLKDRND